MYLLRQCTSINCIALLNTQNQTPFISGNIPFGQTSPLSQCPNEFNYNPKKLPLRKGVDFYRASNSRMRSAVEAALYLIVAGPLQAMYPTLNQTGRRKNGDFA
jgi:hypothetical protein